MSSHSEPIAVTGLTNREFLARYAGVGRVGLSGGTNLVALAIGRAQRHLDEGRRWSTWSHAFLFQGERVDGWHWVVESDLDVHRKHLRFGAQENRVEKYYDEDYYPNLAVLDFGVNGDTSAALLRAALELVANYERYSLRELAGTLFGLRHPTWRTRKNPLAREGAFFCSAFVRHVFQTAGVDLAPGLDIKHTTPEDLLRAALPHTSYVLQRRTAQEHVTALRQKIRPRLPAKLGRRARR